MKPLVHAQCSVKKWGGVLEDYLHLHEWFDQTKALVPDMRHRAILHNSFGCFLICQMYGDYFTNSDGKLIATRDIAEEHILEDMGRIPTVQDYLTEMPMYPWLGGPIKKITRIPLNGTNVGGLKENMRD